MCPEGITADGLARISELERCVPQMGAQIEVIAERTSTILAILQEVKTQVNKTTEAYTVISTELAQSAVKWQTYERDRKDLEADIEKAQEKLEKRIEDAEKLARSNQLTLAKSLMLGGGGGIVGAVVIELITRAMNSVLP